jgi:glycolate oxidase
VAALTAARIVPATVEFMDRASIQCAEDYLNMGLDRTAGALLLIETDGAPDQAKADALVAEEVARNTGARLARRASDKAEAELLWRARRSLSPAIHRLASGKANEDIVVPRSRIPEMVDRVDAISQRYGLAIVCFGHAGDGNIHVNVMYDRRDPAQVQKAEKAVHAIMTATLDLGGTISGEHGIGTTKKDLIGLEIRPEALALMRRIKTAFDPDGIMNPGKVFPG